MQRPECYRNVKQFIILITMMAHKISSVQALSQLNKTSSIFDIFQQKSLRPTPVGQSTTSFTCEPVNVDDKLVAQRKAIFEPSYRLEPRIKFKPQTVTQIINQTLGDYLNGLLILFWVLDCI